MMQYTIDLIYNISEVLKPCKPQKKSLDNVLWPRAETRNHQNPPTNPQNPEIPKPKSLRPDNP